MNKPNNISDIKTGRAPLDEWMIKHYPDFVSELNKLYPDIHIKEQIYLYYNNMKSKPVCPRCGKSVKFHGYIKGYAKFCGPKCAQLDEETRTKHKSAIISKFGENYQEEFTKKCKATKLLNHGDENYNNKEKSSQTCIERYGVNNPLKSKEIRKKINQTNRERYGTDWYNQSEIGKTRIHKSSLKKIQQSNPDVINKDGDILTCRCTDPTCNKCESRIYNISYNNYYERKYIYNIPICPIQNPFGSTVTNNKDTSIEKFIKDILDEYNIDYICNHRNIIQPKELDIYIPNYKLAIECNGLYWHSDKDKKYHYNKYKECESLGIQLLTIWEDQIISKPDIVKSIILSKLNIYNTKIGARKCIVKEVDSKDAREFINNNHLQGYVNSSLRIGLYYNDELVSIMTFGKKRVALGNKDSNGWELYRFCNKTGYSIIGGAGKLLKYFLNNFDHVSLESFSSNDISNGDLYIKLGFKYVSESISYWYFKNKQRYHRFKFRKSELMKSGADESLSESEIMTKLGYLKIFDTGQKKWIMEK